MYNTKRLFKVGSRFGTYLFPYLNYQFRSYTVFVRLANGVNSLQIINILQSELELKRHADTVFVDIGQVQVGEATEIFDAKNLEDIVHSHVIFDVGDIGVHGKTGDTAIALREKKEIFVKRTDSGIVLV
mgnify:CR=1 FL=1